ncbi:hypothetical protein K439DRAFT_1619489 [Ramaria rubella]|nr:hypothetical protein K439DRAFT_1619489 [Ramaria rubella]
MPALFEAYIQRMYGPTASADDHHDATLLYILVLGTEGYNASRALPHDKRHDNINQTLVLHGLLSTAPIHPTLAIPITTLALYRRCRLRCLQFSIQQWVKVLCDVSNINYNHSLRDNFSDAFNTHLDIIRHEDHAIKVQLGRDSPNWRILHACPPCQYKLTGEAELNPSVLGALDGNNSLKQFLRTDHVTDPLSFDSDYFLSHEYVDQFKHEVKCKVQKPDNNAESQGEIEGDPTDGNTDHPTCTDRWRAAMADTLKGMYSAFAETGVFISVCRHSTIWTILDMMRSGELAKYPLATVSQLLEVLPPSLGLGYDIACSFTGMLMRSSLGQKACELGLRMVVPAFHGHAHNQLCQLSFHVLMSHSFCLEDLETCERVFAGSNAVARLTRHATPFHRHQFIDIYFQQWDSEKYENLGQFLLNNYKQALEILEDMPERDYLLSKKSEPEADILGVEYVELLDKYHAAWTLWENSQKLMADATRAKNQARLRQAVEESLDVDEQWTLESPEYRWATEYIRIRTYQRAVDKLEGLVVQRLFELTKANISQTGYKQRTHISKALKSRSKAIQRALAAYNTAALTLDPPRPKLTWAEIVEYTTIAEFELLRTGAQEDIWNLEWADSINRQATICYLKMSRAREELTRLNVEIKRLATWIIDEQEALEVASEECAGKDWLLTAAIRKFVEECIRVNTNLQVKLNWLYSLNGFTGESGTGRREEDTGETVDDIKSSSESNVDDCDNDMLDEVFDGIVRLTLDE